MAIFEKCACFFKKRACLTLIFELIFKNLKNAHKNLKNAQFSHPITLEN